MRPEHIEAWVLFLVDQVEKGSKVEDSRIELKAEWPDARAAARRIAGHANASGGDAVLWVIGLDEDRGVLPVSHAETAKWYAQVEAEFDGIAPPLNDLLVPTVSGTVVALLFDTSRRPYVVRNPTYGKSGGGPVSLEVPWRSGTAIRSARRDELVRILVPLQALPLVEVLSASASVARAAPVHEMDHPTPKELSEHLAWHFDLSLYLTPRNAELLVLPVHRACMRFRHGSKGQPITASKLRFHAPLRFSGHMSPAFVRDSETVTTTGGEAIVTGPGRLSASASYHETPQPLLSHKELEIALSVMPAGSDRVLEIKCQLAPSNDGNETKRSWSLKADGESE